jgi:hypothetical protein
MKKIVFLITILFCSCAIAFADGDAGFAGAFMRNGIGARPLGMGGAYTAVAEGPEAAYYNPAGLAFASRISVSMSYKSMSLDRHLSQIAVLFPIRGEAVMAANWVNAGVSDLSGRNESRQITGDIRNNQNSFAVSFAKPINNSIAVGGNLKYLQEKLDQTSAFTIGVDFGFLVRIKKLVNIGGSIQNLGSTYRWDDSKEWSSGKTYDDNFPFLIKLGAAGNLFHDRFIPAVDLEKSDKMGYRFRTGAEYWFVKKMTKQIPDEEDEDNLVTIEYNARWAGLRVGLDRGVPTFGASYIFQLKKISAGLEYAYLIGQEGTSASHLMTLKLDF